MIPILEDNKKRKGKRNRFNLVYLLLLLPLLTLNLACSSNPTLIDETRPFANSTWNRFTPEVFEFSVDNPDDYFRIDFELVVDSALMRNTQMPLTVNLYSPDGERRMFYTYVNMVENGRWKGQATPDRSRNGLRTLTQNIRPFFTFNTKGDYRMEIAQATSQYDLEGVSSFRLLVQRTEIDFSALDK